MPDLDYHSPPVVSRATAAAEKHLIVWTWVFYSLALVSAILGAWSIVAIIREERRLFSVDVLLLTGVCFVFFSGVGFSLWAMGMRCAETRHAMLKKEWPRCVWAIEAFNAMLAISILVFIVATVAILGESTSTSRRPKTMWLIPAGIALFIAVVGWSHYRITQAWRKGH